MDKMNKMNGNEQERTSSHHERHVRMSSVLLRPGVLVLGKLCSSLALAFSKDMRCPTPVLTSLIEVMFVTSWR